MGNRFKDKIGHVIIIKVILHPDLNNNIATCPI